MSQLNVGQLFQTAVGHHQAGRLQEAENRYRQILAQQPEHAGALHHLGLIAHQVGRADDAVALIRQAIALRPDYADAHGSLGVALKDTGQIDAAIAAYRQAITLNPSFFQAYNNLGVALSDKGLLDDAIAAYRQAIALNPSLFQTYNNLGVALSNKGQFDQAIIAFRQALDLNANLSEAHFNLGNALREKGALDEAIAACNRAIVLNPKLPEGHNNLGDALRDKGQLDQAVAAYRQAIAVDPNYAQAYNNLGIALRDQGKLEEAIDAYRRAIALRPNYPEAHTNLGSVLRDKGQLDQAVAACRQAIDLNPNYAQGHNNLGIALKDHGQLEEAIAAYRKALTLNPNLAQAHNNLGNILKDIGQFDEAIAAYRQAIDLRPNYAHGHSNLLLMLHYHPFSDAQSIAEEHRVWNRRHAEPLRRFIRSHANDRDANRRLRLGYVSPDFRSHAVAPMVLPLLASHDREMFEVFCYAEVLKPDAMTERFRVLANQWRNTCGISDEQLADLIREDQIDILVDLAGHSAGNRLLVFARKPAPVQVTRQGYPNTTGLTAIDYRMSDAWADPPGLSDTLHSEQLVRLPQTNWIYQAPENCPSPDHRRKSGQITFGCFNNFAKVTEPMLGIWARILSAVPNSRLLLKAQSAASPGVKERVRRIFQDQGVSQERLEIIGWQPSTMQHLSLYNEIEIGLDPFPYHGTTTTCEAMWMGVPVITLAGQTHVSRVGMSLLKNAGLDELIAQTPEQYMSIAVELAKDLPRLDNLHCTLRQRMTESPLMDAQRFARNIEEAYRRMWRKWCAQADTLHEAQPVADTVRDESNDNRAKH